MAADIGCDHGKLAVELIKQGKANVVIASDISEKSLQKAVINSRLNGYEDQIICIAADGLNAISSFNVDIWKLTPDIVAL